MEDLKTLLYSLAAAACGAYVSSVINPRPLTMKRRIVGGIAGIMVAFWCAVPLADHFGVTEPRAVTAITFGLALFWEKGVSVASDFVEGVVARVFNKAGVNKE